MKRLLGSIKSSEQNDVLSRNGARTVVHAPRSVVKTGGTCLAFFSVSRRGASQVAVIHGAAVIKTPLKTDWIKAVQVAIFISVANDAPIQTEPPRRPVVYPVLPLSGANIILAYSAVIDCADYDSCIL